ncbi:MULTISPECIES: methyltransferase domain-containing protein [Pseudomonas]|uniref:methyltransferase domain-containing protein n=1 Tax=Pseudomonas TaxID=286 RepID=UPI000C2A3D00|nr:MULTISPECIES: methyltransferase domain-containing protein [Pseudomonas]MCP3752109.1 methyltransferase domain-containing protein [Pseudomonas sp. SBB6]PJY97750.1 methyltransferase [Pseudomonas donghuensis]WKY27018.1 methyltransferase domain-containing protein [Pseudomonas donghuensis]
MIDLILSFHSVSAYDFRSNANPADPLRHLFDDWVDYYKVKWSIAKAINPRRILEVGVRYGYSARAFLEACPDAQFVGLDADIDTFGGSKGALAWAEENLKTAGFDVDLRAVNSQSLDAFPGGYYDLIHIDGQQDGNGTYRDLDLAVAQSRYILVDGYQWSRENFYSVNEWLWLNKAAVHSVLIIPGYAGELLIRTNLDASTMSKVGSDCSEPLSSTYTKDYYLNDCGGFSQWRRTKGAAIDSRLQAVADAALAFGRPKAVIDLGAGRGELTRLFYEQGADVTAIDYSADACALVRQTLADTEQETARVRVVCGSVLDDASYRGDYDLAVAADIVEHLSPAENEVLYALVSDKLKKNKGLLVVHTAPNAWNYEYLHPQEQRKAVEAGFWLPRIRRTWYERLMHINEQNPRVLKAQLEKSFPYVAVWFADHAAGGSLLRKFALSDFKKSTSIFAVASHQPIDLEVLKSAFVMPVIPAHYSTIIEVTPKDSIVNVEANERFQVPVRVENLTDVRLASIHPRPVNLSYHLLSEQGEICVFDGARTPLQTSLLPGASGVYYLEVKAPVQAGIYYLQVAAVQETVRWYDQKLSLDSMVKIVVEN